MKESRGSIRGRTNFQILRRVEIAVETNVVIEQQLSQYNERIGASLKQVEGNYILTSLRKEALPVIKVSTSSGGGCLRP